MISFFFTKLLDFYINTTNQIERTNVTSHSACACVCSDVLQNVESRTSRLILNMSGHSNLNQTINLIWIFFAINRFNEFRCSQISFREFHFVDEFQYVSNRYMKSTIFFSSRTVRNIDLDSLHDLKVIYTTKGCWTYRIIILYNYKWQLNYMTAYFWQNHTFYTYLLRTVDSVLIMWALVVKSCKIMNFREWNFLKYFSFFDSRRSTTHFFFHEILVENRRRASLIWS